MERASSQLHTNTSRRKQFQVRVTFEDRHVFTKGPLAMKSYTHNRALKATLTLEEFSNLKNQIKREMDDQIGTPVQTNITSYVLSVFSIVSRFIENRVEPERGASKFDLKIQIWHLKGTKSVGDGVSSKTGASLNSNSMRNTCSVRVWCIDTDGLDPSPELLNQTVETNVDPMNYLANMNQTKNSMKSWLYEPQHERSGFDLPVTWRCSEHRIKGVEHLVIFNRSNLEGITQCGEKESFYKMLDSWKSKQADHLKNDRYRVPEFVTHFGLKPCFMINDASVSDAINEFNYPVSAVSEVAKLFKTASESSDSALPIVGLALDADDFCNVFDIPPFIAQYIVAGGVCAVKQKNKFKHLPSAKTKYDGQSVAHSLVVRAVNIKFIEKTGKILRINSEWREEPSLSLC